MKSDKESDKESNSQSVLFSSSRDCGLLFDGYLVACAQLWYCQKSALFSQINREKERYSSGSDGSEGTNQFGKSRELFWKKGLARFSFCCEERSSSPYKNGGSR